MVTCEYCGDPVPDKTECKVCGGTLITACMDCHLELAHGIIHNQNVHFVGNSSGAHLCSIDEDVDAYKPSDRDE